MMLNDLLFLITLKFNKNNFVACYAMNILLLPNQYTNHIAGNYLKTLLGAASVKLNI